MAHARAWLLETTGTEVSASRAGITEIVWDGAEFRRRDGILGHRAA
jgi:hypothetical protein